jgi:CRP-like cAMP-binding protein
VTVQCAASGVAGIVLGMALKELLNDVISGLALNIDRPIRIGDSVQIHRSGDTLIEGKILEISWRSTRVEDLSNNIIVVPNNKLASATTTNYSQPATYSEWKTTIVIDATIPHERAMRILAAAATEAWPRFQGPGEPPPYVSVRAVSALGVEYDIFYFSDLARRARGRNQILQHALKHLRQAGLKPAMPKQEQVDIDIPVWRSALPQPEEVVRILSVSRAFVGLGEDAVRVLASEARIRTVSANQTLAQGGEAGDFAYLVVEGLLERRPRKASAPVMLHPGDTFGLAVVLCGEAYGGTVRSLTDATVCELGIPAFQALFAAHPETARALAREVAIALGKDGGMEADDIMADVQQTIRRNFAGVPVG